MELLASQPIAKTKETINLRIVSEGDTYSFYYSTGFDWTGEKMKWNLLKEKLDAKFLSTKVAGGFVGSVFGMYATSLGKPSSNSANYHLFEYIGKDEVYK